MIAIPKCILGGAVFGASGCGWFVFVVVMVVVEGDDGGVVVVVVVLTAFVGVLIIIVLGVLKLSVCYVVVVINTNTISPSVKYSTISTIPTTTPPISIPP